MKYEEGSILGPYQMVFLKRLPKSKGIFNCVQCGKEYETYISSVVQGKSHLCKDCVKKQNQEWAKKIGQKNAKDLTGKQFGELKVLEKTEKRNACRNIIYKCRCSCGTIVEIPSNDLVGGNTTSCGCICSKGEKRIGELLKKENIVFIPQKTFKDCISINNVKLKFDFYLPDYNICIEYDGEQHSGDKYRGWFTPELQKEIKKRDVIKNKYCKDNNIKLIRIPYTDYEKIDIQYLKERIDD